MKIPRSVILFFTENNSQLLPVFLQSLQQRQLAPQLLGTAGRPVNDLNHKMTAATALLLANKDLTVGLVSYNFY